MKTKHVQLLAAPLAVFFTLRAAQAAEIHEAAEADDVVRIQALLATNSALVHLPGKDDLTPLHVAARSGSLKAAAALLEHGADVNAADVHGCSPLHSAVYGQRTRVAEFLLSHGANVNAARDDGTTPLYYAAADGDTNLVALLLKNDARPAGSSLTSFSPLHAAAKAGRVTAAAMLVDAGASVGSTDAGGHTPLHIAAVMGQRDMAEWLLNHGANADARDRTGLRPVDVVTGPASEALVSLLLDHMKSRADQVLPANVGEAGDPDRLIFEGLKTFTSEQIRRALAVKPGYLLVAHPQANLRAFLTELSNRVQAGYQAAGFPNALAEVSYDPKTIKVLVKVTEGPRFKAGKIEVVGAKASSAAALIRWFTTAAERSPYEQTVKTVTSTTPLKQREEGDAWDIAATASVTSHSHPGLNLPGKTQRPDAPMWITGDPANFSAAWTIEAQQQVETCLAEQGFFFPKVKVEIQRDPLSGIASLLITLTSEGPPGVIGAIHVSGMQRHSADEIIRFLQLREGMPLSAERLTTARRSLLDSGRFWDAEIAPERTGVAPVSNPRVDLQIALKEQPGVPPLSEPLSPVQQALMRMCEWLEQFPSRDEDIQMTLNRPAGLPFDVDFIVSPKHGLLINNAKLQVGSPMSAGVLVSEESVQLCAWDSGSKLAVPRESGAKFFLHLLPDKSGGTNRFSLTAGAGLTGTTSSPSTNAGPHWLEFDIQLSRAAFLDLPTRQGYAGRLEGGQLLLSNDAFSLRAEANTGRLLELNVGTNQSSINLRFGVPVWTQASRDFTRRAAPLTNTYAPGRRIASFLTFAATEAARWRLMSETNSNASPEQRTRALAAVRKLLNPEFLPPLDRFFGGNETNAFIVPSDELDQKMALNSVATIFGGFAFQISGDLFPKYSWPWTVARESAFVLLSQGRYTDVELERLYGSDDTGPIGCLMIARLLRTLESPTSSKFAVQGLVRLHREDFLKDCDLFLRGDSGLARTFAKLAEVLRTLPEDELAALVAVLPETEASLLRESAAALRAHPDGLPAAVLAPAIGKYWQETLRARVREALRPLTVPPARPSVNAGI
jgi:ankyrin repeat protein